MSPRKRRRTKAERDADARRTGRPPVADAAKTKVLRIRVTEKELAFLRAKAKEMGIGVAALLRRGGGLKARSGLKA